MNIERFTKEIEKIQEIQMTVAEKDAIKSRLLATFEPTPSPWNLSWSRLSYLTSVSVAVFVLVGTTVAFASEKALPGDLLYPVKVNVSEPIRTVLVQTPQAKAEWEAEKINRRLQEAEQLSQKGELDDAKANSIKERIDTNLTKLDESIREARKEDEKRSREIEKKLREKVSEDKKVEMLTTATTSTYVEKDTDTKQDDEDKEEHDIKAFHQELSEQIDKRIENIQKKQLRDTKEEGGDRKDTKEKNDADKKDRRSSRKDSTRD
jgi:hypothetical protein